MALALNNPIVANDIHHIRMFKELKVWLLEGGNNDKLVIKTDAVFQQQYKSASPIIKAIAPGAKLKVLSQAELNALQEYIRTHELLTQAYQDMDMNFNPDETEPVARLKESLGFGFPFVKMAAVNVSDLEGALKARLAPNVDKTSLRAFTATLNAPGGLETLGKIIAVDLFNGNTDRFFPGAASTKNVGGVDFNLRCLVNIGNVFRAVTAGGSEVGALDFIDPNSIYKDINTPLAQAELGAAYPWPARLLTSRQQRHAFAKDVVHDLEKILNPHKSRFSLKTKLTGNSEGRVASGMKQGAFAIKLKLEAKYINPNQATQGILDRHQILSQVH